MLDDIYTHTHTQKERMLQVHGREWPMREALGGSTPVVMTMAQLMGNLANVSRSDQKLSISLATIATIDNESFTTTTTREKKVRQSFSS